MKEHYNIITSESLSKVIDCFADQEEFATFLYHLHKVSDEMHFNFLLIPQVSVEDGVTIALKQVISAAMFYREHIELMQQLIRVVDCQKMTKEQVEEMEKRDNAMG